MFYEKGQLRDEEVDERLDLSQREWRTVVDKLFKFVYFRLKDKTLYGAHTESNLKVNPADYYVDTAIEKLISGEWKWKRELSIDEQLKRIVNSLMSSEVRIYENNIEKKKLFLFDEVSVGFETYIKESVCEAKRETDKTHKIFYAAIEECVKNDKELQSYTRAFEVCDTFDEMQKLLHWPKKKLYALQKKLTRKIKSYLRSITNEQIWDNT